MAEDWTPTRWRAKYYVAEDWTPKKLEAQLDVPDTLDLEPLRSAGVQPGEVLQPETIPQAAGGAGSRRAAPPPLQPSPEIVEQLVAMGFSENGSKRATLAVQNASAEASMEWVLSHMEDPGFNDPLEPPAAAEEAAAAAAGPSADPEAVSMLQAMGFTDQQATAALLSCGGNTERAGDWLFSHMDDLDSAVSTALASQAPASTGSAAPGQPAAPAQRPQLEDGPGRYELAAFISHMGSNLGCGHYVAHVRKEGRWVLFNDDKVALSAEPPRGLGYMYLFQRVT